MQPLPIKLRLTLEQPIRKIAFFYGRMSLPTSNLEMFYLRRRSPQTQLRITAVSDTKFKNGGTILALVQQDVGKYSTEYLYSTSEGLVGARGLYNFGHDPRSREKPVPDTAVLQDPEFAFPDPAVFEETDVTEEAELEKLPTGRLSMGAEVYYGVLNKSGGSTQSCLNLPHLPLQYINFDIIKCPLQSDTPPFPITLVHR